MSILPLTLTGLTVTRRGKRIVGPVDFVLEAGGPTVFLGPNGAGKTTLLRAMHGIERLSEGRVDWALPRVEAELRQSFVFQTPIILRRTVADNIAYPLIVRGVNKGEALGRARHWARSVGLGDAEDRSARVLSGGEKQKMAIARALITDPEVLFLDEPTTNLDGRSTREIETVLREAIAGGTRLVMATHDLGQARRVAREIAFIYNGAIHEFTPADQFFDGPKTVEGAAHLNGDIVE